jgi:hypothetical protein
MVWKTEFFFRDRSVLRLKWARVGMGVGFELIVV